MNQPPSAASDDLDVYRGEDRVKGIRDYVAEQQADVPDLHVGDHVTDLDDPDGATMLVVGLPLQRAATYDVGTTDDDGEPLTVADFNPEYPAVDHVIEAVYPQRTDVFLKEKKEYAFPRSRLELETPIHDRDADGEDEEVADGE